MALPLFVLMVCLLLSLVLLWRHDWLYLRPSSRGGAKRGTYPRLSHGMRNEFVRRISGRK